MPLEPGDDSADTLDDGPLHANFRVRKIEVLVDRSV
jgi:hypothetical protein